MCLLIEEIDCVSRFDFSCGVLFFFSLNGYLLTYCYAGNTFAGLAIPMAGNVLSL